MTAFPKCCHFQSSSWTGAASDEIPASGKGATALMLSEQAIKLSSRDRPRPKRPIADYQLFPQTAWRFVEDDSLARECQLKAEPKRQYAQRNKKQHHHRPSQQV